jgi:hypothetical protein
MFLIPVVAVLATLRVAVIVVEFTTVKVPGASDTPPPRPVSPVAPVRFAPVRVTATATVPVAGCVAEFGLIAVSLAPCTVKGTALLAAAAPATVTVTLWAAVVEAPAEMVKVAVNVVELVTVTPLTVMPPPETATVVSPFMKFVPVSVTGTAVLRTPVGGATEVNVGVAGIVTVNATVLLTPPGAVTETVLAVPAAPAVIVKVVVISVSLTTVIGPTVMPPPATVTAVVPVKPLPKMLTGTAAPCPRTADVGAIDVSTGPSTV